MFHSFTEIQLFLGYDIFLWRARTPFFAHHVLCTCILILHSRNWLQFRFVTHIFIFRRSHWNGCQSRKVLVLDYSCSCYARDVSRFHWNSAISRVGHFLMEGKDSPFCTPRALHVRIKPPKSRNRVKITTNRVLVHIGRVLKARRS